MEQVTKEQLFSQYLTLAQDNPELSLIIGAVFVMTARKVWRHFKGKSQYTLRDLKKYPGEALELAMIVSAFVAGLIKFLLS